VSGLAKAVAALDEVNDTIRDLADARLKQVFETTDPVEAKQLADSMERLGAILAPFPLPDSYKGLPTRRIQTRIWAGIITNPNGSWSGGGGGSHAVGAKKSVYYDATANEGLIDTDRLEP